jgi:chromosome partitioning protein
MCLAEAPSYGLPGVVFDPNAKGSIAFVDFAREMVERVQRMAPADKSKIQAKSASSA